ncbi:MAG: Chemotaxis protein [Candidatus Tokpelaia hoelldobleri]|uniref:Chemotaxis protein n=1 Tax=Candidatus Tokpelaia hoelldobleri TaxID=1902579 RepID=A0A1U9JSX5_9HYPH|nr:MAG: Chemotaxis protein [Candidatus Tokpelaia hoelldoblerii]
MTGRRFIAWVLAGGIAGLGTLFSAVAAVAPDAASPAMLVRLLQIGQDDVASGQRQALAQQARTMSELSGQLSRMAAAVFEDEANFHALLIYLLNGGDRDIVKGILARLPEERKEQPLARAALAFSENHKKELMSIVGESGIDKMAMPEALRLSAYLGTVPDLARKKPQLASDWLDYVRTAAPGSLFEEAAIRRQLRITANLGDIDKTCLLVRSYASRFANSPYASDFWSEFVGILPMIEHKISNEALEALLKPIPSGRIQYISWLQVARSALIDGRMDRAFFSASRAEKLAQDMALDDTTARLYTAASKAGSTAAFDAAKILKALQADHLHDNDRELLIAALTVAQGVIEPPASQIKEGLPLLPAVGDSVVGQVTPPNTEDANAIDEFVKKMQKKLDDVDALLKEQEE